MNAEASNFNNLQYILACSGPRFVDLALKKFNHDLCVADPHGSVTYCGTDQQLQLVFWTCTGSQCLGKPIPESVKKCKMLIELAAARGLNACRAVRFTAGCRFFTFKEYLTLVLERPALADDEGNKSGPALWAAMLKKWNGDWSPAKISDAILTLLQSKFGIQRLNDDKVACPFCSKETAVPSATEKTVLQQITQKVALDVVRNILPDSCPVNHDKPVQEDPKMRGGKGGRKTGGGGRSFGPTHSWGGILRSELCEATCMVCRRFWCFALGSVSPKLQCPTIPEPPTGPPRISTKKTFLHRWPILWMVHRSRSLTRVLRLWRFLRLAILSSNKKFLPLYAPLGSQDWRSPLRRCGVCFHWNSRWKWWVLAALGRWWVEPPRQVLGTGAFVWPRKWAFVPSTRSWDLRQSVRLTLQSRSLQSAPVKRCLVTAAILQPRSGRSWLSFQGRISTPMLVWKCALGASPQKQPGHCYSPTGSPPHSATTSFCRLIAGSSCCPWQPAALWMSPRTLQRMRLWCLLGIKVWDRWKAMSAALFPKRQEHSQRFQSRPVGIAWRLQSSQALSQPWVKTSSLQSHVPGRKRSCECAAASQLTHFRRSLSWLLKHWP